MDTALNIANLTTEPVAAAGRRDAAVMGQQSQAVASQADKQDGGEQGSNESSFANVLKSESSPAKTEQSRQRPAQDKAAADQADTESVSEAQAEPVDAEEAQATEDVADGQQSELLLAIVADSGKGADDPQQIAAGSSKLQTTVLVSEEADNPQAVAQASVTATDTDTDENTLLKPADMPLAKQAGDNNQHAAELQRKLSDDSDEQVKQANNSESFSAAGKTLPPPGKSLPAGFFPAAGSDPQAFQRLGDKLTHSKDPISLDGQFLGRMESSGKLDIESGGDKLLRSILTAQAAAGGDSPTASTASQTGSDASTVLNQFTTAGSVERGLTASRPGNTAALESMPGFSLTAAAGSSEFDQQLSSRIRWMGNLKMSAAELKLHPAELGSIEVRISTEDDQTRVSFVTSNAAAREIIESSMPRLRELLGDSGLQLEQGDVSQREQGAGQADAELGSNQRFDADEDSETESQIIHMKRESRSQVDHYV